MMREMYADLFYERAQVRAMVQSVDKSAMSPLSKGREKRALIARLNALNDSLGEPHEADDPLLEELEDALQRGEEVDLTRLAPVPKAAGKRTPKA
ncbi:MAG: hypothetical protein EOO40_02710 [Deltaproteobacteria bacterium]|nr:MAG: hypothetical protein EOO40_02710 [Deltaproteobacteria bacterium]